MLKKLKIKINNNIHLETRENEDLLFRTGRGRMAAFKTGDPDLADFICSLANQGASEHEIEAKISEFKSPQAKLRALEFIRQFSNNNFIRYELRVDALNSVALCPYNTISEIENPHASLEKKYKLSRFSYIRSEENHLALANPLSSFYLLFQGTLLLSWLLSILDGSLHKEDKNPYSEQLNIFLNILIMGKFIQTDDDQEPANLKTWEFHDLLFNFSTRMGKSSDGDYFGGTYRFGKNALSQPAQQKKQLFKIKLYKPEGEHENTPFLFEVLQKRRSIRKHGENPISLQEIGEFLYRSVAVQRTIAAKPYNTVLKPYPSGGGMDELAFYVVCNRTKDLKSGIYFYDAHLHELCCISQNEDDVEKFIAMAASSMGQSNPNLQVLIVAASKFQKMAWKYEKIAYRSTLMNVGAAFQTMYLVATAMNLAPCAIGGGNPQFFSSIAGLDALEESSVGEFALGTQFLEREAGV